MTPPLSAFDHLSRGLANLRANPQLVPWLVAQQVAVAVLSLLSVAALFLPLVFFGDWVGGLENLAELPPELIGEELVLLLTEIARQDVWTLILMAAGGLIPSTLVGVVALLVYSWLAGGIFGTLRDGEERAPLEEGVAWRHFRAYRWQRFSDLGGRFMWPYFWYVNYFVVLSLLATLLVLSVLALAAWGGQVVGPLAALAVGCAGLLPCLALFAGLILWYMLGLAEMVRRPGDPGRGVTAVRRASRGALGVLRRRWAALLVLVMVFLGANVVLSFGVSPMGMYSLHVREASVAAWWSVQTAAHLVQVGVVGVFHVAFYATLTALVRRAPVPGGGAAPGAEVAP